MRFLLTALLFSATASAATTAENAAKYQALRQRLNTEFIVVGDAPGMSQPADERIEPQGIIRWADSTIGLGWYIGALASEHYILSHPELFPGAPGTLATTADELYFALRAMERLDLVADASFPPPCSQEPKLNGFFLRDDVPDGDTSLRDCGAVATGRQAFLRARERSLRRRRRELPRRWLLPAPRPGSAHVAHESRQPPCPRECAA